VNSAIALSEITWYKIDTEFPRGTFSKDWYRISLTGTEEPW
jgi:hypothetical protein